MRHESSVTITDWETSVRPPASLLRPKLVAILRLIFSFPVVLSLALTVLTVLTVRGRFNDPDLWWHLKVGETIWATHFIPNTDLFSSTAANHAWVAHEWLSETLIYGAYRAGGHTGLMIWLCALPSLLFVLVYVLCSLYSRNAKISLVGGLVAWFFGTVGLSIRPHILGYICLVLELLVVHLARTRDRRWFWMLPPLLGLWVNCHGSFILGLMVLGIFLICSCVQLRAGSLVCSRWPVEQRRLLAITSAIGVGALFFNPIGWQLVLYPFDLLFKQTQNLASITEWQPLDLLDPRAAALFGVAGFIFLMVLIRRVELRLDELLLLALGFGLAIRHERMLFIFGIVTAPIVCRLLANAWDRYDPHRDLRIVNAFMMAAAVGIILAAFPKPEEIHHQITIDNPAAAVDYIRRARLSGNMLNEYIFGGYLIWALPENKVFIDGRCDLFDWTGVLTAYGRWATLEEDPKLLLDKYHIDYCLLQSGAPKSQLMRYLPGWKKVYQDKVATIFVRSRV